MIGKFMDLTGKKFGKLTVIERVPKDICPGTSGGVLWRCKCECGNIKEIRSTDLTRRKFPNCGCYTHELLCLKHHDPTTHGYRYTRLYRIWTNMKSRCYNVNHKSYEGYGGRGITVCEEWKNDFVEFKNWAIENGYRDDLTIDRIDNDGDYKPNNCRWVTMREQSNNRRSTKLITYNGETHSEAEWARILGAERNVIHDRLKKGWSIERTLSTPVKHYKTKKNLN